ncbi:MULTISPECIES: hypothetical protein [Nostoc cyanobionts]|nr:MULTISPECIES: hypothetical protein [unclassified Nostoc]
MSKIRYSKDCKQVATAFLDASNCGCQECGAIAYPHFPVAITSA